MSNLVNPVNDSLSGRGARAVWLVDVFLEPRVKLLVPVTAVLAFQDPVVFVGPDDQATRNTKPLQHAPVFERLIQRHTKIVFAD